MSDSKEIEDIKITDPYAKECVDHALEEFTRRISIAISQECFEKNINLEELLKHGIDGTMDKMFSDNISIVIYHKVQIKLRSYLETAKG